LSNPQSSDLSAATGNTISSRNNKIFVDYFPCDTSVSVTVPYSSSASGQALGCSCNIPTAYYFVSDSIVPCQAGTISLNGPCPAP
jgi:hypothetical protein